MIGLGEPVLDAVFVTDAVEDVPAKKLMVGTTPVLGQVGEGHAIIGEHDVDLVGEDLDHVAQKG